MAAALSGEPTLQDFVFKDAIPLSFGTDIGEDGVYKIIEKNTTFPITRTKKFETMEEGEDRMIIKVLQGDEELASKCHKIAQLRISLNRGLARS